MAYFRWKKEQRDSKIGERIAVQRYRGRLRDKKLRVREEEWVELTPDLEGFDIEELTDGSLRAHDVNRVLSETEKNGLLKKRTAKILRDHFLKDVAFAAIARDQEVTEQDISGIARRGLERMRESIIANRLEDWWPQDLKK